MPSGKTNLHLAICKPYGINYETNSSNWKGMRDMVYLEIVQVIGREIMDSMW